MEKKNGGKKGGKKNGGDKSKDKLVLLKERLEGHKATIHHLMPGAARKYLTPDRVIKIVLSAASRNPLLLSCTPQSMLKAIMEVAPMGLEVGGPSGHVYLVPFFNGKTQVYEAVPIPGYRGYLDIAYRSGRIKEVVAALVHKGDGFRFVRRGAEDDFYHEPRFESEEVEKVYCIARFAGGGQHVEVMTKDEVDKVRARSRAKNSGPWVTDYGEMAKKTVVRRARKYWPECWELSHLAELDNQVDTGTYTDPSAAIDAEFRETGKAATEALADRLLGEGGQQEQEEQGTQQGEMGAGGDHRDQPDGGDGRDEPGVPEGEGQTKEERIIASFCWDQVVRWTGGEQGAADAMEKYGARDWRELTGDALKRLHRDVKTKMDKEEENGKQDKLPF